MDYKQLQLVLEKYGVEKENIDKIIDELDDVVEEVKEEVEVENPDKVDDVNYLSKEVFDKLYATDEGKDIIMKAPEMSKEELKKVVKEYLARG